MRRVPERGIGAGLSSLFLCLLTVALLMPGTVQAQMTPVRPSFHTAVYCFTPPCKVAAVVDENGAPRLERFDVKIYEKQPPWVPRGFPRCALALTSGDRVIGIADLGLSVPRSVNADGTVNWKGRGEGPGSFTGFLVPVAESSGITLMSPSSVYVATGEDELEVAYARDGELIVREVDVGATVERCDVVGLDDHRTVLVVETPSGTRTVLVDRASGEVRPLNDAKVGYGTLAVAVAVPERDGTIIVAASRLGDSNPSYLPPLARVEVRGARVLAVKPHWDSILAVAEVGNEITLLAVDTVGDELLPVRKEREDGNEITFAVNSSVYGSLSVVYDEVKGEITSVTRCRSVIGAEVPSVDVEFLDLNLANPDAHGGVKLDLTRDVDVKDLSEIADVKVMRGSEVVTGKLYRIETTWGRFYGVVTGDRLVLIPAVIHPMLCTGDGGIVREVEVDVQPNSDGTVTVVVHDPVFGDLKVPECVVTDWSRGSIILPEEALVEEIRGKIPDVNEATLGAFVRARITATRVRGHWKGSVQLPDGTIIGLDGTPILALALKDGKLAVITATSSHEWSMYVIDPAAGSVVGRCEVVPVPARRASEVDELAVLNVAVLVPEGDAIRVLVPYPHPCLFSALDVLPVVAEAVVPVRGGPGEVRVRMVPLRLKDGSTVLCCAWESDDDEPCAVAVEARGGGVRIERVRIEGETVYLPRGDRCLRVDTVSRKCETVASSPADAGETQMTTKGEQQGDLTGRQTGRQDQHQRDGQSGREPGRESGSRQDRFSQEVRQGPKREQSSSQRSQEDDRSPRVSRQGGQQGQGGRQSCRNQQGLGVVENRQDGQDQGRDGQEQQGVNRGQPGRSGDGQTDQGGQRGGHGPQGQQGGGQQQGSRQQGGQVGREQAGQREQPRQGGQSGQPRQNHQGQGGRSGQDQGGQQNQGNQNRGRIPPSSPPSNPPENPPEQPPEKLPKKESPVLVPPVIPPRRRART